MGEEALLTKREDWHCGCGRAKIIYRFFSSNIFRNVSKELVFSWAKTSFSCANLDRRELVKKVLKLSLTRIDSLKEDRVSPASGLDPTIQKLRAALEASYRSRTPEEHFQRMVRNGLINCQGQLTTLYGGDADPEPGAQRPSESPANSSGEH